MNLRLRERERGWEREPDSARCGSRGLLRKPLTPPRRFQAQRRLESSCGPDVEAERRTGGADGLLGIDGVEADREGVGVAVILVAEIGARMPRRPLRRRVEAVSRELELDVLLNALAARELVAAAQEEQ